MAYKIFRYSLFIFYCSFAISLRLNAQIAMNSWRTHSNYLKAKGIEQVKNQIYCFTENGFFSYNTNTKETTKYSKINGLHGSLISAIAYQESSNLMFIGYQNGLIDMAQIDEAGTIKETKKFDFIQNTQSIQSSKKINDIYFTNNKAYLACDFGLVVFDIQKAEIKETYQNLGENGDAVEIQRVLVKNDSIFIKTPTEIRVAPFSDAVNLQYYGNWSKSKNTNIFNIDFSLPVSSANFQINDILRTPNGTYWIADETKGLLSNETGSFISYSPNGLNSSNGLLLYQNQKIYFQNQTINVFEDNLWQKSSESISFDFKIDDSYGNSWELAGAILKVSKGSSFRYFYYGNGLLGDANCFVIDHDGLVWIGTSNGVAIIATSSNIIQTTTQPSTPYFQGKRLLLQENINKIVVDGGNRKWIGTNNGLFLFNANADEQIYNFTAENSPLYSSKIIDLAMNQLDGELFIQNNEGLLSYRTDATERTETATQINIFPNPIKSNFDGVLTLEGFTENTQIKITDLAGKLLYETTSNGGTATWNLQTTAGKNLERGIYFVFSVDASGNQRLIGKFAAVN